MQSFSYIKKKKKNTERAVFFCKIFFLFNIFTYNRKNDRNFHKIIKITDSFSYFMLFSYAQTKYYNYIE